MEEQTKKRAAVIFSPRAGQDLARGRVPGDVIETIERSISNMPYAKDDARVGRLRIRRLGGYEVVFALDQSA